MNEGIFYINKDGGASLELEKVLETCPFISYCVVPISNREVCEGKKGDYRECGTFLHYTEQDMNRERFRESYLPKIKK